MPKIIFKKNRKLIPTVLWSSRRYLIKTKIQKYEVHEPIDLKWKTQYIISASQLQYTILLVMVKPVVVPDVKGDFCPRTLRCRFFFISVFYFLFHFSHFSFRIIVRSNALGVIKFFYFRSVCFLSHLGLWICDRFFLYEFITNDGVPE